MVYLLAGLGVALLLFGLWRFLATAQPATVARALRWTAVAVLLGAVAALVAFGQSRYAAVPAFLVLPFFWSLRRRRGRPAEPPRPAPGDDNALKMTRDEAAEILGVKPDAGREEVIAAHARQAALRQADGASRWTTARLDRARDVLLGRGS